MTRILYVDVIGGAAGDMILAGLIDAGAPIGTIRAAVESVLPGRFKFETDEVRRAGLRARLLRIEPGPLAPARKGLAPTPLRDLIAALDRADLSPPVQRAARSVLDAIGEAEGRVHGVEADDLSLHELGDDDTLLDLVGIAAALDVLGVERLLVSAIPLGTGRATAGRHVHGEMPLPATVTLELLRGFTVRGEGADETITPTAAAVLAALGTPAPRFPAMAIEAIGYGAGNDDPRDRANVVRLVVGTEATIPATAGERPGPLVRELVVLDANLDDLAPELVADAAQALFSAGALDVWTTPVQMKKGRPGVMLSVLGDPIDEPRLRRVVFETTSTFGVRSYPVRRTELDRQTVGVWLREGSVRVKVGTLDGRVVTATPEHDDVAALAARIGRPVREVYEEAVAAARSLRYVSAEGRAD